MQTVKDVQPVYLNLDTNLLDLKPVESTFLHNNRVAFGRNKQGKQGQNFGKGKKMQSNWALVVLDLPKNGINKTVGFYEQNILNEAYVFVANTAGQHSIHVIYGASLTSDVVYLGSNLNFSIDPRNYIAEHRVYLRVKYDILDMEQRHPIEKMIFFTNGDNWQYMINVISSIATNSYDPVAFPYYQLSAPHFDKDELIQYAIRPPMFAPVVTALPRTAADLNKQNLILNKSTSFAARFVNTDGRASTLSPFSNPFYVAKSPCSTSRSLTRAVDVAIPAGSPHTEMIQLLVRNCGGDWMLYDTIYKYTSDTQNAPEVIGDQYWLRKNPWAAYQYDSVNNLIHYTYEGDRQVTAFPKDDAIPFYNDIPIKSIALTAAGDSLIWANNLYNYDNLPTETMNKFQFSVAPGDNSNSCKIKNVKISVYAFLCKNGEIGQVVYQNGTEQIYRYGALGPYGTGGTYQYNPGEYKLFPLIFNQNKNFICYLAGTPYAAVGVQYKVDAAGVQTLVGPFDRSNNEDLGLLKSTYAANGFFVQRFDFYVPAGKYIARIANHFATLGSDYSSTSDTVMGLADSKTIMDGAGGFILNAIINTSKEMLIDASAGDVDVWRSGKDLFYIFVPGLDTSESAAFLFRYVQGYLYEDTISKNPIELVSYALQNGGGQRNGTLTDHNGYFWAFASGFNAFNSEVNFTGFFRCVPNAQIARTTINQPGQIGSFIEVVTLKDNYDTETPINNRIVISGKVVDCDTGEGIGSVGITITNSPTFFTDSEGNFSAFIRENAAGNRSGDQIYFNTGGQCQFASCQCGPVPTQAVSLAGLPCSPNSPRNLTSITIKLKLVTADAKGLKGGGRYGWGATFIDFAGRPTFLQEVTYLDIPTFIETGVFVPSVINWVINGLLKLPDFVKYITLYRTGNVNLESFLQWVGDKIAFIDNKGNTVPDGNGAIRAKVTLQSLLDFNVTNNFNTNVTYQFVQGDVLRIYDDGQGALFSPANNNGFMDYQILGTDYNQTVQDLGLSNVSTVTNTINPDGSSSKSIATVNPNSEDDGVSLVVEYDERLLQLFQNGVTKTGFWIEIMRPKDISQVVDYCEIVGTIPVKNGEPVIKSGTLDTYDTYLLTRSIRIPNELGKSISHPFESPSISDYYGKGCTSCGRNNIKDPLAKQLWYEDEVIKTDEIINDGRVNGLGRCRTENRKNFKGQSFGGIVSIHAERSRLIFICERDWFKTDFEVNNVQSMADGQLRANLDQAISEPYSKEGSIFGCAYEDTATIVYFDGTSLWADRYHSAVIALDYHRQTSMTPLGYKDAVNIGAEDVQSYFINKFNYINKFNSALAPADYLSNLVEIIGGIDPQTGEYNLTFRPRMGLKTDPQYFVNDEREVFYDLAETFIYNPDLKKWVTFAGYAPEFYGKLTKAASGIEMIAFAAGAPWFHNSIDKPGVMNFFGVQTNHVLEVPMNFSKKVKIFQNVIVESPDVKYFIDRILTEDENFFSYVPPAYFKRKEKVYYAEFLCNMNSYPDPNHRFNSMLLDGGRTFGKVALVRFVGDLRLSAEYSEVKGFEYNITSSEKSEG